MKFFEQIYVIVLPKQQVLPQKNMVKSNFLVSMGCGRRLICQNIHYWKNYASCIFSKVIKKFEVKQKQKTSNRAFFFKRSIGRFRIFHNFSFFNNFWKNTQGIVFSTQWIFEHLPPSAKNGVPKQIFDPIYFWKNLSYRQGNCLYLFKKYHPYWIMTDIVTFPKMLLFMNISQLLMHI